MRWGAWGFRASRRVEALTRTNPWAPPAPPHRRPWGRAHPATPHGVPPALGAQRYAEGRTRPAPGCAMLGATRARALALPRQAALAGAHASLARELWHPRPDARDRARPSRRREIRGREERRMWTGERARVGAGIYSVIQLLINAITATHQASNGHHLVYYRGHRVRASWPNILLSLNVKLKRPFSV